MKTRDMIHPEDSGNLLYWTKKWRVTSRELSDAILHTGSVDPAHIREYLRKDLWRFNFLGGILSLLKFRF